jgi:hypothetical protein
MHIVRRSKALTILLASTALAAPAYAQSAPADGAGSGEDSGVIIVTA